MSYHLFATAFILACFMHTAAATAGCCLQTNIDGDYQCIPNIASQLACTYYPDTYVNYTTGECGDVFPVECPVLINPLAVGLTCNSTCGETNLLDATTKNFGGWVLAQLHTNDKAGYISDVNFYVGKYAGRIRFGIYDNKEDNGQDSPDHLLGQTDSFTLSSNGWLSKTLQKSVYLEATKYWIAYAVSNDDMEFKCTTNAAYAMGWIERSYGTLPSSFDTFDQRVGAQCSAYMDLAVSCPSPTPAPTTKTTTTTKATTTTNTKIGRAHV